MKLHFEPNLDYQRDAINAVCDLFNKWERCTSVFTVSKFFGDLPGFDNANGYGNWPERPDESVYNEVILEDLLKVQLRHGLKPSQDLKNRDFTVEMETGTGKTYVYLRTIFELYQRCGFTKFVIVVPSVAIK